MMVEIFSSACGLAMIGWLAMSVPVWTWQTVKSVMEKTISES